MLSRKISISLVLFAVTFAIYFQVGNHEFINFDDNVYVTDNAHVAQGITGPGIAWAFTSFDAGNWHPVTWLSHMTDVQLYGMNPRGHHLTSVAIHAASAALLFLLLFEATGFLWQSSFVAAMFALHPSHVESVAWVAERKDVLSAFFWFVTLLLYTSYAKKRDRRLYLLSLFSFVMGLMCKPMLVTLPVVLLLMDFWPLDRYRLIEEPGRGPLHTPAARFAELCKEKIPFFACSLLSSVVTVMAQRGAGAMVKLEEAPFQLRLENSVVSYVRYIVKTFWPHDFAILYPFPPSIPLWQVIGSLLFLLAVSGAVFCARRRYPYLVVGWLWFLVTLVPVIGLVQVGVQSHADRYSYIPMIGIYVMVTWGVAELARALPFRQPALAVAAGAAIIACSVVTWQQLGYWRDDMTLDQQALRVTTDNFTMHYNLGYDLDKMGNTDAAIAEFQETLRIHPRYTAAHNSLGLAYAKKGYVDLAIKEYRESLSLKPDDADPHYNLGLALVKKGDIDAAIDEFQEVLKLTPNDTDAHRKLGEAFARKGNVDAAIREFQACLALNPNDMQARDNLMGVLALRR